ncbi:GAD-like domain-containing protein [Tateyamaria armeniaca]|uniref:GAD-like domain-containing protein n=1 Tax=Tateyamaria armeniaca TaxID=2518930 RepID=A0ABW8USM6_9RHOB
MTYISEIRGRSGKDHIDSVLNRVGPLADRQSVDEGTLQAWTGTLPDILIDFWRHHGLGTLQSGLMRLCLPDDFQGLLSQIFHADKDLSHTDCHVIGYGPFGHLVLWSARHWIVEVDLLRARVSSPGLMDASKKKNENASVIAHLLGHQPDSLDAYDDSDNKLFKPAVGALGQPQSGEAFGFFPALAMGGAKCRKHQNRPGARTFSFSSPTSAIPACGLSRPTAADRAGHRVRLRLDVQEQY